MSDATAPSSVARSTQAKRSLAAATRVAERLLARADAELCHVDRSTERKVCDRVVARLLDAIGELVSAHSRPDDSDRVRGAIDRARDALDEVRWGLGWIRRRRAVAPSVHNALAVGTNVVERRIEEARREIARIPGRW